MDERAAWLALAYRSGLSDADKQAIALGAGPETDDFPSDIIEREEEDVAALDDLGVRLITLEDEEYPERLRGTTAPIVLQVAGSARLLEQEGVAFIPGSGKRGREALAEHLDAGDRTVVVLSKGMLSARSMLRALHEQLEGGNLTLVSAEHPRAAWGPIRDANRDRLLSALSEMP